jgi:thioredoxin-like negative regulator of GroEL
MVMIWAPWSAHSREAFDNLQRAREQFANSGVKIDVMAAADPGSRETDIKSQLEAFHVSVPRVVLSQKGLALTEGRNQMPTTLLFRDGVLMDSKLGAQSEEELKKWVGAH